MRDLCEIAGANPVSLQREAKEFPDRELPQSALLLTESGSASPVEFPIGWTKVLCGSTLMGVSAHSDVPDVALPEGAEDLVKLIQNWTVEEARSERSILIGSWHGGSGVTTSSFVLAEALNGVVLDASGTVSFPFPNGLDFLFWEDIDPLDMAPGASVIAAFPRVNEIPTLTSASPAPLRPRPDQVVSVVSDSPRVCVIDCGSDIGAMVQLWDELAQAGQEVCPVLLGRATDRYVEAAVRAFGALDADSLDVSLNVLTLGRTSSLFSMAQQRFRLRCSRAPNPRSLRGWRRVAERI